MWQQVFMAEARILPRIRAELQALAEPTRTLARRYKLNPKTVATWRARATRADTPMGSARPRNTVLTPAEEAIVVEFNSHDGAFLVSVRPAHIDAAL